MTLALQDKVALITGGCSGFGEAAVKLFVEQGCNVVIADLQQELGEKLAQTLGASARFTRCDVTQEDQIKAAIDTAVEAFGGLDILFNNAGGGLAPVSIEAMTCEHWDANMALNLRAAMLGMKHAAPLLRARGGGAIINTASIAGLRAGISTVPYSVAKAGLIQLTRMAAAEFAHDSIRINAICPGTIPTPAFGSAFGFSREDAPQFLERVEQIFSQAQPLPRAGNSLDIAQMALFLASDASSYITGQEFVVDGGMTLMGPASIQPDIPNSAFAQVVELAQQR